MSETTPGLPPFPKLIEIESGHTTEISEFVGAFAKAQALMGHAAQTAHNPHFKRDYADLGDVIDVIRGPLTSNNISFIQLPRSSEGQIIIRTIFAHMSGQYIWTDLGCAAQLTNPQALGSVITYIRRYSLQTMAGIATRGEDDDGEAGSGRGATPPAKPAAASAGRPAQGAPSGKPATSSSKTEGAPTTAPPAELPEAVKPWAKRFGEVTKEEFSDLVGKTRSIFDDGTAEKKALASVIARAAKRLGIEPKPPTAAAAPGAP